MYDDTRSPNWEGSKQQKWEPRGCRMVKYSADDLHDCLGGRKLVFAGDSTIRQLFCAAARRLDPAHAENVSWSKHGIEESGGENKHRDLTFEARGVRVEFIWDPWLNSTALHNVLRTLRVLPTSGDEKAVALVGEDKPPAAALVVVGAAGLWAARYGGDSYLDLFERGINRITPYLSTNLDEFISSSSSSSSSSWLTPNAKGTNNFHASQVLLAPIQVPLYENLSPNRSRTITHQRIQAMNSYLSHLPSNPSSHVPWTFNRLVADPSSPRDENFMKDGLHVSDAVAARKLDLALNVRCNSELSARSRSFRGTCCVQKTPRVSAKLLGVGGLGLGLVELVKHGYVHPVLWRHSKMCAAAVVFVHALLWCWFCDGTTAVGKEERRYRPSEFLGACLLWLGATLWVRRNNNNDSSSNSNSNRSNSDEGIELDELPSAKKDAEKADGDKRGPTLGGHRGPGYYYLSREHSDEMKGWMQGFILLYHYHHASQTLWVYKLARLFISTYFFLSGYGHTLYFLRTRDFSARRFAVVFFRLNVLSALLPYVLGTQYTAYYFAPVVSFWYVVQFLTLRCFGCFNRHFRWVVLKVAAAACFTDWLIYHPGILEWFSWACDVGFRTTFDAAEMRFRLGLDRYIVYIGILVAALVHRASYSPFPSRSPPFPRFLPSTKLPTTTTTLCIASIAIFLYLTQTTLPSKPQYTALHPYISWLPILAFTVLRSSSSSSSSTITIALATPIPHFRFRFRLPVLRQTHASVLAQALGRVSLETYVLQYHAWLGGDATARLTLGLGRGVGGEWWWGALEVVLFSVVFFGMAVLVHEATEVLARGWITPRRLWGLGMGLWLVNIVVTW